MHLLCKIRVKSESDSETNSSAGEMRCAPSKEPEGKKYDQAALNEGI